MGLHEFQHVPCGAGGSGENGGASVEDKCATLALCYLRAEGALSS
eukprot:CAMPEP_0185269100 /NCGR_PEP_ID=MMETSP1359-20130426/38867_1 /TAXON_ID=552665 /ORGANISM="Bigelowiella longifila, Strain CCMP242" /LENGTH=44 /DNA_ID= /DNA_START= /DNA_END= /DNA_ORIENTATION=